ncbi:RNA-binding S4 domain-containing protein [Neisseriaceae bacterium ESL0693]|nr:RNA-binding S4 domain-containing protein [Neisseriaceae bacterium ESL0693]
MQQQFDLAGHPYVALCDLLKLSGWAHSGGEAKHLISAGQILRNQQPEQRKTAKIKAGERISMHQQTLDIIDSHQANPDE